MDTNIVIAALIKRAKTQELLFDERLGLFSPKNLLVELEKYREMIMRKAKFGENEYEEALAAVMDELTIVEYVDYKDFEDAAIEITPDQKDWPFFALAMKLGCALWSNDRKLKEQNEVEIVCTDELIGSLGSWQQD